MGQSRQGPVLVRVVHRVPPLEAVRPVELQGVACVIHGHGAQIELEPVHRPGEAVLGGDAGLGQGNRRPAGHRGQAYGVFVHEGDDVVHAVRQPECLESRVVVDDSIAGREVVGRCEAKGVRGLLHGRGGIESEQAGLHAGVLRTAQDRVQDRVDRNRGSGRCESLADLKRPRTAYDDTEVPGAEIDAVPGAKEGGVIRGAGGAGLGGLDQGVHGHRTARGELTRHLTARGQVSHDAEVVRMKPYGPAGRSGRAVHDGPGGLHEGVDGEGRAQSGRSQ